MKSKLSSIQVLVIGFFIIITLGTILLMLPFATRDGETTTLINAIFTATSATCVTGFSVYDTYAHWTLFGQITILSMIQIGGLGFMSIATFLSLAMRRKITLKERGIMQEALNMPEISGVVRLMRHVLFGTVIFELCGAVIFSIRFIPIMGIARGIYTAVFHSVSSFCNAGFDLFGRIRPGSSLECFNGDVLVNVATMALIIIGGIGFYVWEDIHTNGLHFKKYKLHTKMVLTMTLALIIIPAVLFFALERNNAYKDLSTPQAVMSASFQSVTLRTAGFSTVNQANLTDSSALLGCALMLVGGSPGSTAGGIKTTSFMILILGVVSMLSKRDSITSFKRRLPHGYLTKVSAILTMYLFFALLSVGIICAVDTINLRETLYEVFSAIGTVGVEMTKTGALKSLTKGILTILMFFGRIGGLSLALAFAKPIAAPPIKYPTEKISVG